MKRTLALVMIMVTLAACFSAQAANGWYCTYCNTYNTGNYCTYCGRAHAQNQGYYAIGKVNDPGSSVNLRSQPTTAYDNVIVEVPHGATVYIYGESGNFFEVSYMNYHGYMYKTYIVYQSSQHGGNYDYSGSTESNGYAGYYTVKDKLSTRTGPGTDYDGRGKTSDYSGYANRQVKVISAAYDNRNGIWWVQIEIESHGQLKRAYTGTKRFYNIDVNNIPKERVLYSTYVAQDVIPYYGPGSRYAQHSDYVAAWTWGDVIAIENGYAQFEYTMDGYKHRCWIPESKLQ